MSYRIEEKLSIDSNSILEFKNYLNSKTAKQIYQPRKIESLYFENNKREMYNDSLEGLTPRKKIRVRNYPGDKKLCFYYEIKISSVDGRFKTRKIISQDKFNHIKTESKFSDGTRFDFLLSNDKEKCFLEVKNVTLLRENKIAEFPDAITSRGTKHLNELCNAKKKGYQSYILYLIQRENCNSFKIAKDIDEEYKIAFSKALKSGVKILCYDCKLNSEEIKLNKQINYEQ